MLEAIAVALIVTASSVFAVRSIYRTLSGKDKKRDCMCGKCTHDSTHSCSAKRPK